MNLLEFAIQTVDKLSKINDSTFASQFVEAKSHCFHTYQKGHVTSNSHGISFFDNVIKFWDNPDSYYTPKDTKGNIIDTTKKEVAKDDYEYNFIRILKFNKEKTK